MSKMVAYITGTIKREARHSEYLLDLGIENGFPAGHLQPRKLTQPNMQELVHRVQSMCDYEGIPVRVAFDEPAGMIRWSPYEKVALAIT